jgi:hypothetical protein
MASRRMAESIVLAAFEPDDHFDEADAFGATETLGALVARERRAREANTPARRTRRDCAPDTKCSAGHKAVFWLMTVQMKIIPCMRAASAAARPSDAEELS